MAAKSQVPAPAHLPNEIIDEILSYFTQPFDVSLQLKDPKLRGRALGQYWIKGGNHLLVESHMALLETFIIDRTFSTVSIFNVCCDNTYAEGETELEKLSEICTKFPSLRLDLRVTLRLESLVSYDAILRNVVRLSATVHNMIALFQKHSSSAEFLEKWPVLESLSLRFTQGELHELQQLPDEILNRVTKLQGSMSESDIPHAGIFSKMSSLKVFGNTVSGGNYLKILNTCYDNFNELGKLKCWNKVTVIMPDESVLHSLNGLYKNGQNGWVPKLKITLGDKALNCLVDPQNDYSHIREHLAEVGESSSQKSHSTYIKLCKICPNLNGFVKPAGTRDDLSELPEGSKLTFWDDGEWQQRKTRVNISTEKGGGLTVVGTYEDLHGLHANLRRSLTNLHLTVSKDVYNDLVNNHRLTEDEFPNLQMTRALWEPQEL